MEMKPLIYSQIENDWTGYEVTLKDIVRSDCTYQHYLRYIGEDWDKPKRGPAIIVDSIEKGIKDLVFKYLKDCYGDRLEVPKKGTLAGFIDVGLIGCIEDCLIDVAVLPDGGFASSTESGKLPLWVTALAATKAHLLNKKRVFVIVVNRNNQKWASFSISGDLSIVATEVLEDVKELSERVDGKSPHVGRESSCFSCGFSKKCVATKRKAPLPYSVKYLKVSASADLCTALDRYLVSLNERDSGRAKFCVHPSEFSVFQCDRRIAYGILGTDKREKIGSHLRRIFDVGHVCHDILQGSLKKSLGDACELEVPVDHERTKLKGHCDGVVTTPAVRTGIEIKSISRKGFDKLSSAKKDHQKQGTLYAVPLDVRRMNYLYINKDTGSIKEFVVPISKGLWHDLAARAESIIKETKNGSMPERITKEYLCRQCPYAWSCKPEIRSKV